MRRLLKPSSLFLPLFLAGLLLIGLLWYRLERRLQTDRETAVKVAVQRNTNLVVALEQFAVRTISNADALLQLVKKEYEHHGRFVDYSGLLNGFALDREAFVAIAVCDAQGNITSSSHPLNGRSINLRDREFFQHQARSATDDLFIGRPMLSRLTGQVMIPVSRRVSQAGDSFGGVVVVHIKPSAFTRFYGGAQQRPHDIISLMGTNDAITLSRRTGNRESYGENISKSPLFGHLKQSPTGSYFSKDVLHGVPTYFSYRKLEHYPLVATVGSAEADVLAEHLHRAQLDRRSTLLISVLIVVLMLLFGAVLLHRRKAVQQIEASEQRYRSVFENSSDAILLVRPDNTIAAANKAARNLFGYPHPTPKQELPPLHLEAPVAAAVHRLKTGAAKLEAAVAELQFVQNNGHAFAGELTLSSFTAPDGRRLSVLILHDRTEQLQLQQALEAEQQRHQRQLTQQVIQAQERERESIGRELHDNVNQVLTTVKLYLEMAIAQKDLRDSLLPKSMAYVVGSINEIRHLSRELSAPTLGTKSLIDSVSALVDTLRESSGLTLHFRHETYKKPVAMDQKLALYRIVQEQVNNIIRHAGAKEVEISLQQTETATTLCISDDGKGFDTRQRRNGVGLNNILGRAKVFDGDVQVASSPGQGCRLTVTLPIVAAQESVEHNG